MSVAASLVRKAREDAGLTARELATRANVSVSTVTRVERGVMDPTVKMLARLLDAAGVDVVIELRERRPSGPRLRDLRRHTEVIQEIVARHGGTSVRVFGSVSRGTASATSDVDLLVDVQPGTGLFEVAAMEDELNATLPWHVDVLTSGAAHGRMSHILDEAVTL